MIHDTTDTNIINSNRKINVEGTKGNINIISEENNNVLSIIPFFTRNTYHKIADKVGGISLKKTLSNEAAINNEWNKLTEGSHISAYDTGIPIPSLDQINLFNVLKNGTENTSILANLLTNDAGLLTYNQANKLDNIKNLKKISLSGSTVTEIYSQTVQVN